ncbi:MAG: hypothetical protein EOR84_33840 [Mesorhizobium sp.]|uniref:GXWXG domain-containing protein n=1 Tax=Mesorhizobium sp. TaxID=1871066 RepID=UPI000FE72D82|nr:MAG: hypothetical protein EOR84_33840 [Mesorhizobium sp.]
MAGGGGSGLRTRRPLDGLLEWFGWYDKPFETPECLHPLLFLRPNGDIFAIDSARIPLHLALRRSALLRSRAARKPFAASRHLLLAAVGE